MITEIIPVNHRDRVPRVNALYQHIKENEGNLVEVIVACDNPAIFDLLEYDVLVGISKRLEFTRSVNIAQSYATHDLIGYLDDSVKLPKRWALRAVKEYRQCFPENEGLLSFRSDGVEQICWSRGIANKRYLHKLNQGNMLWPEYLHSGDYELAIRAKNDGLYRVSAIRFKEKKINDESWRTNNLIFEFDKKVDVWRQTTVNRAKQFLTVPWYDWHRQFKLYCQDNEKLKELYQNFYSIIQVEVRRKNA